MLNFALVGCGRIAKKHSESLAGIKGARLAAVCDIVEEKAKFLSGKYRANYYINMHEMLEKEKNIDVVAILTPSGMHAGHIISLAKYKKHIVVEKPMTLSLNDAGRAIKACWENNIKLFVVRQNRFNLPIQKLKETIERKRFGKLVMGTARVRWCRDQSYYDQGKWRGTWLYDGGIFANQASHHIDLLLWLLGDVDSVFAKSSTRLVNIDTEDTGIAVLRFKNGALGVVEATTAARPKDLEASISVLGEKGAVEISGLAVNELKAWNFNDDSEGDLDVLKRYSTPISDAYGYGHKAFYKQVVGSISHNKNNFMDNIEGLVEGAEEIKNVKLVSAIYESIRTGKEVFL